MKGKNFKYTNKQYFLRGAQGFFSLIFGIMFLYILINFRDFWEHDKLAVSFILFLGIVFSVSLFRKSKSNELKSNAYLSDKVLIVGGTNRYELSKLQLDEYVSNDYHCFHLYNNSKTFTIYTNVKDDLFKSLLASDLNKNTFNITKYHFNRTSLVTIKSDGRTFTFDLDTGKFSFLSNATSEKEVFEPRYFVQTPIYKGQV